jgi:hypothetical protein
MENIFWIALATSTLAASVASLGIYTIRRFHCQHSHGVSGNHGYGAA